MSDYDDYTIEEDIDTNGDDILPGDEIYVELYDVDEKLSNGDLSVMEKLRLERHKKFLEQRIEELELSRIREEEERDNMRETEINNMMKDLEISQRQIKMNKLFNRFDEAILRSKRGDIDTVTLMLSTLFRYIADDIPLIESENIQPLLQEKARSLLDAINNNENLIYNVNRDSRHRNIPSYVNQIFNLLNIQGLETNLQMDTSNDEAYARQLQEQYNRGI
jgi:hypothetical protein